MGKITKIKVSIPGLVVIVFVMGLAYILMGVHSTTTPAKVDATTVPQVTSVNPPVTLDPTKGYSCPQLEAAGIKNIPTTSQYYHTYLDSNHNGVACEVN